MNRSTLTEEAFQALLRLKQDMYAVELLRHRLQFRLASDRVELARLQVFVNENADAFERVSQLRVVGSATG